MNFVLGRRESDDRFRRLVPQNATRLPVPASIEAPTSNILLGLRPEWIRLAKASDVDVVQLQVEMVEPTGPDFYSALSLGGCEIMARLPGRVPIMAGKVAKFVIDHNRTIPFDQRSGRASRSPEKNTDTPCTRRDGD